MKKHFFSFAVGALVSLALLVFMKLSGKTVEVGLAVFSGLFVTGWVSGFYRRLFQNMANHIPWI